MQSKVDDLTETIVENIVRHPAWGVIGLARATVTQLACCIPPWVLYGALFLVVWNAVVLGSEIAKFVRAVVRRYLACLLLSMALFAMLVDPPHTVVCVGFLLALYALWMVLDSGMAWEQEYWRWQ